MARRLISSGSSFEALAGYSRAVIDGDWAFVSGTTGYDYAKMAISPDVAEQTEQCFANIRAALTQAGFDTAWLLDPCYNVMFGSWILAQNVARHGMTWEAVGAYHSSTDWRAQQYSRQVAGRLAKILRKP